MARVKLLLTVTTYPLPSRSYDELVCTAGILEDGSWIAVRPSGTEPKIKIYYSIKGTDKDVAEKKLEEIQNTIQKKLGLK